MANLSASLEKQSLIPQLDPPLSTAAPSEVRAFITELLILTRNLSAQHAKEVADKWRLGTGRELTTYPPSVYADIFGSEDAWMVYKESQLFIRRAEQEKNKRQDDLRKCTFPFLLDHVSHHHFLLILWFLVVCLFLAIPLSSFPLSSHSLPTLLHLA